MDIATNKYHSSSLAAINQSEQPFPFPRKACPGLHIEQRSSGGRKIRHYLDRRSNDGYL
uniref:Uncharacterized protein n=1 Tax=Arundo donax TaxID=35708 RepID=A0A0A9DC25_ARUDO